MKRKASKCVIPRMVRNPKAAYRWLRGSYLRRVRAIERSMGGSLYPC